MWSVEQYERFKDERRQPFDDLVSFVERRPRMRIVDLGCGTGELTRELHEKMDAEETLGIDSSETMLIKSGHFGSNTLRFERGEIEGFVTDRPYDLVFSNAALHWVPDHESLFHRLTSFLGQDGQLAIQMPANDDHPSHRVAAELAAGSGIAPRPGHLLPPETYASLLHHLGFRRQHVRLQVYGHVLPSPADVVEWVKGTLLTEYEQQLTPEKFERFVEAYRAQLLAVLPDQTPFFYTYKRILIWGSF